MRGRWRLVHVRYVVVCVAHVLALVERAVFDILTAHLARASTNSGIGLADLIVYRTSTLNHWELASLKIQNKAILVIKVIESNIEI